MKVWKVRHSRYGSMVVAFDGDITKALREAKKRLHKSSSSLLFESYWFEVIS